MIINVYIIIFLQLYALIYLYSEVVSRASRARLKAVAKRKGRFEKFLALRLSTGDRRVN
jgi:hypothetical protein